MDEAIKSQEELYESQEIVFQAAQWLFGGEKLIEVRQEVAHYDQPENRILGIRRNQRDEENDFVKH